jgi:hypothetical protein
MFKRSTGKLLSPWGNVKHVNTEDVEDECPHRDRREHQGVVVMKTTNKEAGSSTTQQKDKSNALDL